MSSPTTTCFSLLFSLFSFHAHKCSSQSKMQHAAKLISYKFQLLMERPILTIRSTTHTAPAQRWITSHQSQLVSVCRGKPWYTHVSDMHKGQTRFVFELLSGGNRAHIGMAGLDSKYLQEIVHMEHEVKKCSLMKTHQILPHQNLRHKETK